MSKRENDYDRYVRILDITFRTCVTMLAIVFAYTLGQQTISQSLQICVTVLVVFITVTVLVSGIGIIIGRKKEPESLKGLAVLSLGMLVAIIIGMLILLLITIWR